MSHVTRRAWHSLLLAGAIAAAAGCGRITDKDRIRVAKIGGEYITRGDLFRIIREMPDDERPMTIKNKGDLLQILNDSIDERLSRPLAAEVGAEFEKKTGKPIIPREAAAMRFFKEHHEDNLQQLYQVTDAEAAGMSDVELKAAKETIDLRIDRLHDKMIAEAAVAVKAIEALQNGTLKLEDPDFDREYKLRKDELKTLEWMQFRAIRFPVDVANSEAEAAAIRRRLDAGESFDAIEEECRKRDPSLVLASEIENNPNLAKFQGFWLSASGAEKGTVFGPVFLPEYQVMGTPDKEGKSKVQFMPAAYLVVQVLDRRPERILTLDEAKARLLPFIATEKMMRHLRESNGVEIYEDKLPDLDFAVEKFGKSGTN